MSLVGCEPVIPARERLQTHALDHAATGIVCKIILHHKNRVRTSQRTVLRLERPVS
jgi:hypothetical protein